VSYTLALGFWSRENFAGLELRDRPALGAQRLLSLGQINVEQPSDFELDPYGTIPAEKLSALDKIWDNVRLLGYRPPAAVVLPGDSLRLLLRWQAQVAAPAVRASIRVVTADQVLAQIEYRPGGAYPSDRWQAGEQVLDRVLIQLPPNATSGSAQVELAVGQSQWLNLETITVQPIARVFTFPVVSHPLDAAFGAVAELVGYTVAASGEHSARLTLIWRAVSPAPLSQHYKVFVHALAANGDLLAQDDAEPAAWTRPTTSWMAGEYITDEHTLSLPGAPAEAARFRVGMYDADSLQRLPVGTGDYLVVPNSP
jgi:hypothetical protein